MIGWAMNHDWLSNESWSVEQFIMINFLNNENDSSSLFFTWNRENIINQEGENNLINPQIQKNLKYPLILTFE